jgi:hypothetical protein
MTARNGWIAGILALALLCMVGAAAAQVDAGNGTNEIVIVDDVEPYDGPIGPGNPLYGLKIAFENLDESFTGNETERFNKQLNHARLRLSEVKRELQINNTDAAASALALYEEKINATRLRLQAIVSSNATGLLHAQERITKHQLVLENLLNTHPENQGLHRAYNNSLALEQKFSEKTQTRFERVVEKNNATIAKAVRLEAKTQQHTNNTGIEQSIKVQQTEKVQQGQGPGENDDKGQKQVTETPTAERGQKENRNK